MATATYAGRDVQLNDEGFLIDSTQWTPEVGEAIANDAGIDPLTNRHWQVITFCREDAAKEGQPPGVRRIAQLSGVAMRELYALFPKGPGKLAARISGLPKPQGCI
jgi:TusE/DsrC/DsvC family sulfur relay protein